MTFEKALQEKYHEARDRRKEFEEWAKEGKTAGTVSDSGLQGKLDEARANERAARNEYFNAEDKRVSGSQSDKSLLAPNEKHGNLSTEDRREQPRPDATLATTKTDTADRLNSEAVQIKAISEKSFLTSQQGEYGIPERLLDSAETSERVIDLLIRSNHEFLKNAEETGKTFIFYTDGQAKAAMSYAKDPDVNGLTLEMTPAGQALEQYSLTAEERFGKQSVNLMWRAISKDFASNASGDVVLFGPRSTPPSLDRIKNDPPGTTERELKVMFAEEWDTLRANPKIDSVFIRSSDGSPTNVTGFVRGILHEH